MNNVLAIAHKEIKAYFASPIAYTVIGFFALLFGYFFYALLVFFDRQSMQMAGFGGPQSVNVNEQLIRPVGTTFTFTVSEDERAATLITFELLAARPLSI